MKHGFDLELRANWQLLDSDAAAGRELLTVIEVAGVHLVNTTEVCHIREEDRSLDRIGELEAIGLSDRLEVLQSLVGLWCSFIGY